MVTDYRYDKTATGHYASIIALSAKLPGALIRGDPCKS